MRSKPKTHSPNTVVVKTRLNSLYTSYVRAYINPLIIYLSRRVGRLYCANCAYPSTPSLPNQQRIHPYGWVHPTPLSNKTIRKLPPRTPWEPIKRTKLGGASKKPTKICNTANIFFFASMSANQKALKSTTEVNWNEAEKKAFSRGCFASNFCFFEVIKLRTVPWVTIHCRRNDRSPVDGSGSQCVVRSVPTRSWEMLCFPKKIISFNKLVYDLVGSCNELFFSNFFLSSPLLAISSRFFYGPSEHDRVHK